MAFTNGHLYRFDEFEVDPANRLLLRDGECIHVTGRVFDVLLVFLENPGRLLEKNELIEKVWQTGFVEDGNLTRNVSSLRKALGDTAREHKYIVTVQGHGYRFVADVTDVNPINEPSTNTGQVSPSEGEPLTGPRSIPISNAWLWLIPILAILILAAWAAKR